MSINSLANAAIARRTDSYPYINRAPESYTEIAAGFSREPKAAEPVKAETRTIPPEKKEAAGQESASPLTTALKMLRGYIPDEIISAYILIGSLVSGTGFKVIPYYCFIVLTPLATWGAYVSKIKEMNKTNSASYKAMPVWEMMAALIAFAGWGCALPGNPFEGIEGYSPQVGVGVAVMLLIAVSILAKAFQNKLKV